MENQMLDKIKDFAAGAVAFVKSQKLWFIVGGAGAVILLVVVL